MTDPLDDLGPLPEPRARFEDVAARLAACERADVDVSLAALGEIPPPAHLEACGACRETFEGRRRASDWLALLPTSRARLPVRRRWGKAAAVAAALLLAVFASVPKAPPPPPSVSLEDVDEEALARAGRRIDLKEIRALGAVLASTTGSDRRYVAVRLLVHAGGPAARQELLRATPDAAVAAGLGDLKCLEAVPRLIEWLDRPELRSAAAAALGRIGDPRAIPALALHRDLRAGVVRTFGDAAARYADPGLLGSRDPLVTHVLLNHAVREPAFRGPLLDAADADTLLQALLRPELRPEALARPVEALVPRLAALLPDPEALRALAGIGSEDAWAAVVAAGLLPAALPFADHARLARVAARWAGDRERAPGLARALPPRAEYAAFFRGALNVPDARAAACVAIRRLNDREAVPKLIPFVRDDREVAYTLKSVTGEEFGPDRQAWWRWWQQKNRKS